MIAVDTNILVRFLVRDDEKQAGKVRKRFRLAEANNETIFVPLLVVLETIWVLEAVYAISRHDIVDSIDDLSLMPILKFEAPAVIQDFIVSAREISLGLSDLLIDLSARHSDCESVATFDKKASKTKFFEMLK